MFLDSDFNGGSWGNFEEDYKNFGSMGTTIGNTISQMQQNAQNQIDEIQEGQNKGKVIVKFNNANKKPFGGVRPKFPNQEVDLSAQNERLNGLTNKYLSKANSFSQENQSLRLQLKTAQEQNKNMMMYGLLGIIAIILITKNK
tara:strand:+ start:5213 stop:5641 length:429 start_codon:yes stop_codon:yes gene_type:complete